MKIGVISDTHIPKAGIKLPKAIDQYFQDVDLILHAGDLVDMSVIDGLSIYAKVTAVCGNMDPVQVRNLLPTKEIINVNNFTIGLIHGWGPPWGLEKRIAHEFTDVDCIVYGHSHSPTNKIINGILFFNPGSPTDKRFANANSIGLLEVGEKITGRIIHL